MRTPGSAPINDDATPKIKTSDTPLPATDDVEAGDGAASGATIATTGTKAAGGAASDATITDKRETQITSNLLLAVAYGQESRAANVPLTEADVTITTESKVRKRLFNPSLYAEDLLLRSPEYLLERAHLTDWAGRTFKGKVTKEHPDGEGITAFEYALWAEDFKMIEMMLSCIPESDNDIIRAQLLEQANQVRAPVDEGGGLSYTVTYKRPRVNAHGIPTRDDDVVTEEHTENHFNSEPLISVYQDYADRFDALDWDQRNAFWIRKIGAQQRMLPIHILQRYCDPGVNFFPLPQFNGPFRRSMIIVNLADNDQHEDSIFSSLLSIGFALLRGRGVEGKASGSAVEWAAEFRVLELEALRKLDEVNTNEINHIIQRLHDTQHTDGFQP